MISGALKKISSAISGALKQISSIGIALKLKIEFFWSKLDITLAICDLEFNSQSFSRRFPSLYRRKMLR